MARTSLPSILESIQRRLRPPQTPGVTDSQLLERFLQVRDEAAFELLMWRHGPMVFGVCRRILQHTHDAEDAFQATFLVLARKAASIGKRESISGWLYRVAYRIALRVREQKLRRSQVEQPLGDLPIKDKSASPADRAAWSELSRLVDAELSQIPEKYRTAFILCHLEGKTCEEAAEQLKCPRGTVLSRLGRARKQLQERLASRGWLPAPTPLTDLLEQYASPLARVSPVLIHATAHAALLVALGKLLSGVVSPTVLDLMNGTMGVLRLRRLVYLAFAALLVALVGSVVVWGMIPSGPRRRPPLPATTIPTSGPSSGCGGFPMPRRFPRVENRPVAPAKQAN